VSYRVCTSCLEASGPSTNSPQPSFLTVYWLPSPGSLLHHCFSTLSSYNLSKLFIVKFLCSQTFLNVCHAYDSLLQDEQRRKLSSSPSFKTSVVPNQNHSVVSYMHLIYVFLHIKAVWIVLQICPLFILGVNGQSTIIHIKLHSQAHLAVSCHSLGCSLQSDYKVNPAFL
jgi:hypothetical protein